MSDDINHDHLSVCVRALHVAGPGACRSAADASRPFSSRLCAGAHRPAFLAYACPLALPLTPACPAAGMAHVRMDAGGAGAGAVLERSKMSFKQRQSNKGEAELDTGSGGGDIGKIADIGGDGGGDDDDDDDDYTPDDEDGGDDGRWWHRVPLKQLYDTASVQAVLSVRSIS